MGFAGHRRAGFTLVELLIVVVILGILAGVVLPQISSSTEDASYSAAYQNVQTLRAAVDMYKVNHGKYPGYPAGGGAPTEATFVAQMTLVSKKDGSTAALGTAGYPYGPYIKAGIPENPFNNLSTVKIIADGAAFPTAADDTTGWIFKPETGQLKCNSTATNSEGKKIFDI